jgi:multidrug efflux pump subunit AcrA (membrane-fusion protein)
MTQKEGMPPYYETMIEIGNPVFSIPGITPDAVPGMQVTVDIIGGKRTVMDYILTPIKRATDVAFREK